MLAFIANALGINRAFVWIGAVMLAAGVIWGVYEFIKHQGADEVRSEIERQNNEAGLKGGEARLSRRDCVDAGGVWDFRAGKCAGPAAGDR